MSTYTWHLDYILSRIGGCITHHYFIFTNSSNLNGYSEEVILLIDMPRNNLKLLNERISDLSPDLFKILVNNEYNKKLLIDNLILNVKIFYDSHQWGLIKLIERGPEEEIKLIFNLLKGHGYRFINGVLYQNNNEIVNITDENYVYDLLGLNAPISTNK